MGGIFAGALAIRWAYSLTLFAFMGKAGLMGADSGGYLLQAQALAKKIATGELRGWGWLGTDLSTMPLFTGVVSFNVLLTRDLAPLTSVLTLGLIDAGTCVLVYAIAASIAPRIALPAAIVACLNPTLIVLSGLLYTDTLFVFFATLSLYASLRWLRAPSWGWTFAMAGGLAGAVLSRALIVLWVPALVVYLLAVLALGGRAAPRHLGQLAVAGLVMLLSLAPIITRNVSQYGAWALTPQGGGHLAQWVVPLVNEAKTGTPWATGAKQAEAQMRQRFPDPDNNPFVESSRYAQVGRDALKQLGLAAIAKAWITGAAINLASPAVVVSPPVSALPRTGFYGTAGANAFEKIANFLFRSDNALFAWIALAGIAGVAAIWLIQFVGIFALPWRRDTVAPLLLLGMWVGFVLVINGPVASPKYRLPIEPVLAVLAGAGYCALRNRVARVRSARDTGSV